MAQNIHFKHIGLKDGLSSSNVYDVIQDLHGNLLISTQYGLNKYDGNQMSRIDDKHLVNKEEYGYRKLLKTSQNQVFVGTDKGLLYFDQNQKLAPSLLADTTKEYAVRSIFEVIAQQRVYMLTNKAAYYLSAGKWQALAWLTNELKEFGKGEVCLEKDKYLLFAGSNKVVIIDLWEKKKILDETLKHISSATMINDQEILLGTSQGELIFYNFLLKKVKKKILISSAINNEKIYSVINYLKNINDNYVGVCTEDDGFKILNKQNFAITDYYQNVLDANSPTSNQAGKIIIGENGNIYLTYLNEGMSLFNFNASRVENITTFKDENFNIFQSYVNSILKTKDNHLLIGSTDRVVSYDLKSKISKYYFFKSKVEIDGGNLILGIKTICQDNKNNLWFGSHKGGIIVTNQYFHPITKFTASKHQGGRRSISNFIWDIKQLSDNKMWIATGRGLFIIDPTTYGVDSLVNHKILSKLPKNRCKIIFEDSKANIWLGYETKGLFKYNSKSGILISYLETKALPFKHCYQINEDKYGNVYFAHEDGFSMISNTGQWYHYNKGNGLRYKLIEGFANDSLNNVWIGNHICLIKFDPLKKSFKYFEEDYGMGNVSLIHNSSLNIDNHIYWGSERGMIKFNPYALDKTNIQLKVFINEVRTKDKIYQVTEGKTITTTEDNSLITIAFSGVNLFGSKKVKFMYRMDGYNESWTNIGIKTEINFASLPSGKYTFHIKATNDGIHWVEAKYPLHIQIVTPLWKRPLFIFSLISLLSLSLLLWYRQKTKVAQKQAKLKQQFAELEVRAIRAQMNPHFVFNALNSIQYFTYSGDVDKANEYLSDFAKLMRLVLQQSKDGNISLDNEIELLSLYVKIEALRFDNDFTYEVSKDESIDEAENYIIPSMIVQPFAENAIKHGLVPKNGDKHLTIRFSILNDQLLCMIEDNGIGIEASKALLEKQTLKVPHQSMGMDLVKKRLEMYESSDDRKPKIEVYEKNDVNDKGTRIIITLPI